VIELRVVSTDADYASWAAIKTRVIPNEPMTAEQLHASDEDGRLLLLASRDGVDAGCGVGTPSGFGGLAFFGVRVLPEHRGHGVAHELVRALSDHARALGREGVNAFVDAADPESIAVAERYGLRQVDYQLQQERHVDGDAPEPTVPAGIDVIPLAGRREELLHVAWPLALEAYEDLPLPGEVTYPIETWLRDEATIPEGSFIAFELGDAVGYAGLTEHAEPGCAEHGLTCVRRDRRGQGIARALKQAQLCWAAGSGVHTLTTWTQQGNERMQGLNRSLGYRDVSKVLTMQGPLPL
jgi:Acetyltransferases, including N-acetylases of ribosomal proteins